MKLVSLTSIILFSLLNSAFATEGETPAAATAKPAEEAIETVTPATNKDNFCLFSGTPASDFKYTVVKEVKVGKGTYGGVKDILPGLVAQARDVGADAIIGYTGSQRFGFWPWRMVRPVVRGTAIKWTNQQAFDCEKNGGTTLSTILATDLAPAK